MSQQYAPPSIRPGGVLQPHRGTVVLVLGILGIVLCAVCGIIAWVMGNADLRAMDQGTMDPSGRGMTQAGKICGMVSCILACISLVLVILYFVFIFVVIGAAAASGAGR